MIKDTDRHVDPEVMSGSVSVEFLLVAALVGVVLFSGQPSPVVQLLNAMAEQFRTFSILVAMP